MNKPRLAFMASGRGSNFESIVSACKKGELEADPVGLLVNRKAPVIERAQRLQVPSQTVSPSAYSDFSLWDEAVATSLSEWKPDLVVLSGFLKKLGPKTIHQFSPSIVNIHPSLLPNYGGVGMYGLRVHEAVIQAGEAVTGLTVHQVDSEYDRGQILHQEQINVLPTDTPESLAQRVLSREHEVYVRVLHKILSGEIDLG